jgi:hypothetical protein
MIDGLRALVARLLRRAALRLDPDPDPPWSIPRMHLSAPAFPGDRALPARKLGPYETVLSTPDILTYIDKESFDRLAERVREERRDKTKY